MDGDRDGDPYQYSSSDVIVAVIDTGIDAAHVDLQNGKVIGWNDLVQGRPDPYGDHGPGTHVASIIAGTGEGDNRYQGVAPGAALVGVKVLDGYGGGYMSDVIAGIEWVVSHKDHYSVRVINMSLGADGCGDGTDTAGAAVDAAVDAGITVVIAAGNAGASIASRTRAPRR